MSWTIYCPRCKRWMTHQMDDATRAQADPQMICEGCGRHRSSGKPSHGQVVPVDLMQRACEAGLVDVKGHVTRGICTCNYQAPRWNWQLHKKDCPVYRYYLAGTLNAAGVLRVALEKMEGDRDEIETTGDAA